MESLEFLEFVFEVFILTDEFLELESLLVYAFDFALLAILEKFVLQGFVSVGELLDLFFKSDKFLGFGFKDLLSGN